MPADKGAFRSRLTLLSSGKKRISWPRRTTVSAATLVCRPPAATRTPISSCSAGIKVSLHYFSDQSIAAIANGKPGDIATIKAGIEAAVLGWHHLSDLPANIVSYIRSGLLAHTNNDAFSVDGWPALT